MTNKLTTAASVAIVLHRELEDDYVGLWKVSWHIRHALPEASDDEVREISAAVLEALIARDVAIGSLDETAGSFQPWDTDVAVDTAISAWRRLGRDPTIGELGWLARTS